VADARSRLEALLTELELLPRRHALPGELSRGMKQKLAIACGLIHSPSALLLDEPLTGLDPVGIRRMKQTIRSRAAAGAAVILSSHLLHLVEEICTRVLVMREGRAVAIGSIAEIKRERPELAALGLEDRFNSLVGEPGPG
jgi:ABC-2 type transport system ATP-binding protein